MSTIGDVTNVNSLFQNQGSKETALGKDDFLKLLIAQLQNQDPLNPADATEFTSQLAQFSQLEQLSNMSTKLETFAGMASQVERQSALGLMGEDIVVQASQFEASGGPQTLGYRLENQADSVNLYILDSTGNPVATIPATDTTAGEYFLQWDGTDNSGIPVEPGNYEVVVRALDENEDVLPSQSLLRTTVSGVDLDSDEARLVTTAGTFDMSKVSRVGSAIAGPIASGLSATDNATSSASVSPTTAFL